MKKKIVILMGSPRTGGNTDILCDEFARGAIDSGHTVEKIYLARTQIHPCIACDHCHTTAEGKCAFADKDGFEEIAQKVIEADVFVLATPVYFYGLTAQTKTAMDRFFAHIEKINSKDVYFITVCGGPGEEYLQTTIDSFRSFISCFENMHEAGMIKAWGAMDKGDIRNMQAVKDAYVMGKSVAE